MDKHHINDDGMERFIIFDFGGGTLDVSLVDASDNMVLVWEVNIYKPYENNLKRYQKTHEQLREEEDDREEAYWEDVRRQAQEALQEIQGLFEDEEWRVENNLIQDQIGLK